MKSTDIYQSDSHQWIMFGRDPSKPDQIIDTNQYVIYTGQRALMLDPGGVELFAPMLAAVLKFVPIEQITDLFASHQDPDIISSVGLWDQATQEARLHAPWIWEGFIRHFGMENIEYVPIPDKGGTIDLGTVEFDIIPAHYLHSSGNHHVYDPQAKILMCGDIGAGLYEVDAPLFVEDFADHENHIKMFHQRWMPSNSAKNDWVDRVSKMDIDILAPQHGKLYKGDMVKRFLDWFYNLEVGVIGD